jgi:hypothetical protein
VSGGPDPDGPLDAEDVATLAGIAELYAALDPVPVGLEERVAFAMELDGLDAEFARLSERLAGSGSARAAEEEARTVTFACDSLVVTISVGAPAPAGNRIDGWAAPGADLGIELRTPHGSRHTTADDLGRFEFDAVPPGRIQLVLTSAPGADGPARRVVTPAVEL